MPTYEIRKDGRKPKRLRQKGPERGIQDILLAHPELLNHAPKKRPPKILWFWKRVNGPGDLWGYDYRGRLVIVELKKMLGQPTLKKALKQLRRASRVEITNERIEREYARIGTVKRPSICATSPSCRSYSHRRPRGSRSPTSSARWTRRSS